MLVVKHVPVGDVLVLNLVLFIDKGAIELVNFAERFAFGIQRSQTVSNRLVVLLEAIDGLLVAHRRLSRKVRLLGQTLP